MQANIYKVNDLLRFSLEVSQNIFNNFFTENLYLKETDK